MNCCDMKQRDIARLPMRTTIPSSRCRGGSFPLVQRAVPVALGVELVFPGGGDAVHARPLGVRTLYERHASPRYSPVLCELTDALCGEGGVLAAIAHEDAAPLACDDAVGAQPSGVRHHRLVIDAEKLPGGRSRGLDDRLTVDRKHATSCGRDRLFRDLLSEHGALLCQPAAVRNRAGCTLQAPNEPADGSASVPKRTKINASRAETVKRNGRATAPPSSAMNARRFIRSPRRRER